MVMSNWMYLRDKEISITALGFDAALQRLESSLFALGVWNAQKVIARAQKRAMKAAEAKATLIAKNTYTAKPRKIFNNIFAEFREGVNGQESILHLIGSWGLHRIHFKAIPNVPGKRPRSGVTTQVKRGGKRYAPNKSGFDKPFIMKRKQGDYGMFFRVSGTSWDEPWKNSVEMAWGPSPIQALLRPDNQEVVSDRASEVFENRLRHEIDVLLAGIAGGRS